MLNITQAEAAAGFGVTLRTYRKWEAGCPQSSSPKPMVGFCRKYGVSIDWLLDGKTAGVADHLAKGAQGSVAILPAGSGGARPTLVSGSLGLALLRLAERATGRLRAMDGF